MGIELEIQKVVYGGNGMGRHEGKVIFVPFSAPGDVVEIELTAQKKGFSEGAIKRIITPSPMRVTPPCPVYGTCGGCAMQHINYPEQLKCKQAALEEAFVRIGKINDAPFEPPVDSPLPFNYRSRARFHVSQGKFGFYRHASHEIVDIEGCPLLDEHINSAIAPIRTYVGDINKKSGIITSVELSIVSKDGLAAAFKVAGRTALDLSTLFDAIPGLIGFESRDADTGKIVEVRGETILSYEAAGCAYKTPINSFTQANRALNPMLIGKTMEYAELDKTRNVLDLYCGAGNITIPAAKKAKEALGIENSRSSVKFAQTNARENNVFNANFIASDVDRWLEFSSSGPEYKTLERTVADVVILDPPREGDKVAAHRIAMMRPERIVYVSCAPPTLARDLAQFVEKKYRVFSAVLIDMFPQTYHIECIVGLKGE